MNQTQANQDTPFLRRNPYRTALFLNLGFAVLEIFGGLWTNSLAILADALHDLGDTASIGLSWYLEGFSGRSEDGKYSYGYRRYSLLGALLSTVGIVIGAIFLIGEAIPRILRPEHANAAGMVGFAVLGIAVNGYAAWRMRTTRSMNARAVAWHLIEDVLGWAAVLVVSLVLLVWDIHALDAVLSLLITAYVLFNVARNLQKTMSLFLQAVPEGVRLQDLESSLRRIPDVQSVHHTHVWSLDGVHNVVTTHLVVPAATSRENLTRIKRAFRDLVRPLAPEHTTLEIEFEGEDCSMKETV